VGLVLDMIVVSRAVVGTSFKELGACKHGFMAPFYYAR
jgi:hypothetical protein